MLRINGYTLALVLWLSFLFNIERLDIHSTEVINIASSVYGLTIGLATIGLLLPHRVRIEAWHMQILALISFVAVKYGMERASWAASSIYMASFELIALLITATLAQQVGRLSTDFVETVRALILADTTGHVYTPEEAALRIKHEMQYSRRSDQPLSVIVIEANTHTAEVNLHETAREIHQLLVKRYSTVALLRLLAWRSRRTDFFLDQHETGRMVLVAPRADTEQIPTILSRLDELAKRHMGVKLHYGVATFPDEGLTFDELLLQAEDSLRTSEKNHSKSNLMRRPATGMLEIQSANGHHPAATQNPK